MNTSMAQQYNRQKFTLTELEKLCTLLKGRYAVITPGNAAAVVETLRAVAELMIWGDQVRRGDVSATDKMRMNKNA